MHGKDSSIEKQTFVSFDAFLVWKKLKKQESFSWFVQHRQKRMCKSNETYCFYCNRAGYLQGVEERKRALKTQGLLKIDGKCGAFMKVVVDSVSKAVNMEYNLSHIGHDTRLGQLRSSDELKATIAAKLAKKIPVNAIPDEIRDNLTGVLYRDHLTMRQDIHNIMQQCNLNLVQKHSEGATSINFWVKDYAKYA